MYNYKLTRIGKTDKSGHHRSHGIPVLCDIDHNIELDKPVMAYAESLSEPGNHHQRLIKTSHVAKFYNEDNCTIFITENGSVYKIEPIHKSTEK